MIRAFLALPLPPDVIRDLEAAQAGLPAGRPVPPENLHVTLVFLGEHHEPVIEDLHYAIEGMSAPGFDLRIKGVGVFGNVTPRVLYAAVEPEPALTHLRRKLARAAREAGIALPGERYTPHVTLARFPREMPEEDLAAVQEFVARRVALASGPFTAERFVLYRSTLGRNGPIYEEMADYPLGTPA